MIVFHTPKSHTVNPRASMNIPHTLHCHTDSKEGSVDSRCYASRNSPNSTSDMNPINVTTWASPIRLHKYGISRLESSAPMLIAMKLTICVANGPSYNNSLKKMAWYFTHKLSNWSRNLCASTPYKTGLKNPEPSLVVNLSCSPPFTLTPSSEH